MYIDQLIGCDPNPHFFYRLYVLSMIDVSCVEVLTHWVISETDLHNILRQSYDNVKVTIDLQQASDLLSFGTIITRFIIIIIIVQAVFILGYRVSWLACWTQAQKGLGLNRSCDTVG